MSRARHGFSVLAVAVLFTATACSNPDATPIGQQQSASAPQNAGEAPAPAPPSPVGQTPADPKPRPQAALQEFAHVYINWSYRTLTHDQRTLVAKSVGPARLAEQQAAATSADDSTIQQGHIENTGTIVSITRDLIRPGLWVIVTREQTTGSTQYEGLPASYHVTLARLQHVRGGWAVEEWLPQS